MKNALLILILGIITNVLNAQYNPLLHNYDVIFIKLELEVTDTSTWISGNCTMDALVVDYPLDTLVLELIDTLSVDSVKIDQQICSFTHQNDEIHIIPNTSIETGQMFSSQVFYHGLGISEESGHEWDVGVINLSGITSTNSETYHSKMWWPCKQIIGDKADSMYVYLTTDSTNKAGSIGILNNVVQLPSGKIRYQWEVNFPVAYYLAFFTVSDYIEHSFYLHPSQTEDSIFFQTYLPDSNYLNTNNTKIDSIHGAMEMLSQYYGDYPFERYGYCIVADNPHENVTMSNMFFNYTISYWYYGLMAHMLAHQWFAGSVTCASWQDIWIHEGFATYSRYLGTDYFEGEQAAQLVAQSWHESVMNQPGGSVYVPIEEIYNEDRILDGRLSYFKGAAILHMIRFVVDNDSLFFDVIKNFQDQYQGGSATGEDFKEVLETQTGMDFDTFFDQWYYGEGYPIFDIYWFWSNDTLNIKTVQSTSTSVTTFFETPLELKLYSVEGDTIVKVFINESEQIFKIFVPDQPNYIKIDPNNWVICLSDQNVNIRGLDKESGILIIPNPARDYIQIISDEIRSGFVEIMDLSGKTLIKTDMNFMEKIDVSGLRRGVYLIMIYNSNTIMTKKIIIM